MTKYLVLSTCTSPLSLRASIKASAFSFTVCVLKHTQSNIIPWYQWPKFHTHSSRQAPPAVRMHSDSRSERASLALQWMLATFQRCVMKKCSSCCSVACLLSMNNLFSSTASLNHCLFTIQGTLYYVHQCQKATFIISSKRNPVLWSRQSYLRKEVIDPCHVNRGQHGQKRHRQQNPIYYCYKHNIEPYKISGFFH